MDQTAEHHKFELTKKLIFDLKAFTRQLKNTKDLLKQRDSKLDVQQQLENQGLFGKYIPIDPYMLFRASSDVLYFPLSHFKETTLSLCKFLQKQSSQSPKVWKAFYYEEDKDIREYISGLNKPNLDFEQELALLCETYHVNVDILNSINLLNSQHNYFSSNWGHSSDDTSDSVRVSIQKYILKTEDDQRYLMLAIWPLHPDFEDDEKIDLVRAINVIYSQNFLKKAIVTQNTVYEIFEKATINKEYVQEDDFEIEIIRSNQETSSENPNKPDKLYKPKEKKSMLSAMRWTKSAHVEQPDKLAFKNLDTQNDTASTSATPNLGGSSVDSSSKGNEKRSKLNPKSTVYKVDRIKAHPIKSATNQDPVIDDSYFPVITKEMLDSQNQNLYKNYEVPYLQKPGNQKSGSQNEVQNQYSFKNVSTPFAINPVSEQKSKSHIVNLIEKFPSDTKIYTPKNFTLFGENEIEEELGYHLESDSEDDSKRMAKWIPNNILDDGDSQTQIFSEATQKINGAIKPARNEIDWGSVSSGSDKEANEHSDYYEKGSSQDYASPVGMTGQEAYSTKLESSEKGSTKVVYEEFKDRKFSPPTISRKIGKGVQSSYSAKVIMPSNIDGKFTHPIHHMTPEKYTPQWDQQILGPGYHRGVRQPIFSPQFAPNSHFYAAYPHIQNMDHNYTNYKQMAMPSNSGVYYSSPGVPQFNQYMMSQNQVFRHQYGVKPSSLSDNNISQVIKNNSVAGNKVPVGTEKQMFQGVPKHYSMEKIEFGGQQMSQRVDQTQFQFGMNMHQNLVADRMAPPGYENKSLSTKIPLISPENLQATPQEVNKKAITEIQLEKEEDESSSKNKSKKSKTKPEKRKRERLSGKLKFFDKGKNYGFMVLDNNDPDMFVHFDDLKKSNISKDLMVTSKNIYSMHFTFHVFEYDGKKKSSKKAVDIKLVSIHKIDPVKDAEIDDPVLLAKDIDPNVEITEQMLSNFFNSP